MWGRYGGGGDGVSGGSQIDPRPQEKLPFKSPALLRLRCVGTHARKARIKDG